MRLHVYVITVHLFDTNMLLLLYKTQTQQQQQQIETIRK